MRRAGKADLTQATIVAALRKAGCLVHFIGQPFDLLVYRSGRLYLLECKSKRGSLTPSQERDLAAGWPALIVWSSDDALRAVGLLA